MKKDGKMSLKSSRLFWGSLILLGLAVFCQVMEGTFYGGLDENGVLQESFFLPLSFLLGALGVALLLISVIRLVLAARKG